jgi:hypothetical protein
MSKPGRVLARLTAEEARARPAWAMQANAMESKKRKWRMHMMELGAKVAPMRARRKGA